MIPENIQKVIWQCANAALNGPFFDYIGRYTILQMEDNYIQYIIDHYNSDILLSHPNYKAVRYLLYQMYYFPLENEDKWHDFFDIKHSDIKGALSYWDSLAEKAS